MNYLNQGIAAPLDELLDQREKRGQWLESWSAQFPGDALVCFKMNIPGPIKTNRLIQLGFAAGCRQILTALGSAKILMESGAITGPEMILKTGSDALLVKEKMIRLEEASPLGRLFDIDVYWRGVAVSRQDLRQGERTCLLCGKIAKICARSQAHPLDELLETVEAILLGDPAILRGIGPACPKWPDGAE